MLQFKIQKYSKTSEFKLYEQYILLFDINKVPLNDLVLS